MEKLLTTEKLLLCGLVEADCLTLAEAGCLGLSDSRGNQKDKDGSKGLVHLEAVEGALVVPKVFRSLIEVYSCHGHFYTQKGLSYHRND